MGAIFPKRIHVKPTLRGLVVTDHRRNPRERVGELVAYTSVKPQGGYWSPASEGGNPSIFYIPPDAMQRATSRMYTRAVWDAFIRGELSPVCELSTTERRWGRLAAWAAVACCSVFVILTTLTLATGFNPATPFGPSVSLVDRLLLALLYVFVTSQAICIFVIFMHNKYGRDDYVKLSRDDVTVRSKDVEEFRLPWSRLVYARDEFLGTVLDFGDLGRVRPKMTAHARVIIRRVRDPVEAEHKFVRALRRSAWLVLGSGVGLIWVINSYPQYFAPTPPLYIQVLFVAVPTALLRFCLPNLPKLTRFATDRFVSPVRLWLRSRRLAKMSKLGTGR
jgi:hypothetical protein